MDFEKEHDCRVALSLVKGIGAVSARTLIGHFGSAVDVFKANKTKLLKPMGIGIKTVESLLDKATIEKRASQELLFMRKHNVHACFLTDELYPNALKQCADPPTLFYYKGSDLTVDIKPTIAFVGTRKATPYGKQITQKLIEELAPYNPIIVSGLATGIDAQAHKSALQHQLTTWAVMGTGLDKIYPAEHKNLAQQIAENGALITEFPTDTPYEPGNFPMRNRIVAGLCQATIIVEAAEKGGALITADLAFGYNRDVFAVPGRVNDHKSAGCNRLIAEQKAQMVLSGAQIADALGWNTVYNTAQQASLFIDLTDEESELIALLKNHEKGLGIDDIALNTKKSHSKVASLLLGLEFKGALIVLPGKIYKTI